MPISQQIGSSSLAKPGVCTSTTRPASPYDGMVIYETDTDKTLVWNGSAWVYLSTSTANPVGLEHITSASFSAVTEILFDSVFTSTYRNYLFLMDCQSSAGSNIFAWQVRSGGSTISTATYRQESHNADGATNTTSRSTGLAFIRVGANDANAYHSLEMNIYAPAIAVPTRTISDFNRDSGYQAENVKGANTNATSYDGMRISVASGNMTGAYSLYGYRTA